MLNNHIPIGIQWADPKHWNGHAGNNPPGFKFCNNDVFYYFMILKHFRNQNDESIVVLEIKNPEQTVTHFFFRIEQA